MGAVLWEMIVNSPALALCTDWLNVVGDSSTPDEMSSSISRSRVRSPCCEQKIREVRFAIAGSLDRDLHREPRKRAHAAPVDCRDRFVGDFRWGRLGHCARPVRAPDRRMWRLGRPKGPALDIQLVDHVAFGQ